MGWSPDGVLTAVRSQLCLERTHSNWAFERADLEGNAVLVVFRFKATAPIRRHMGGSDLFGVLYPLDDLPDGPHTGMPSDTVERWAREIPWDLDEQVDVGLIANAARTPRPDLVLLRWRP
jgi:hypothetical protein